MMKNIFFIFLFLLVSCKAQKQDNLKNIYFPKIDSTFEKFDFEKYKNEYKIKESDYITNKGEIKKSDYSLTKEINDTIFDISYTKNDEVIEDLYESIYYSNSPIKITKIFYSNGNIQKKGIALISSKGIGIWYHFDEDGKLIEKVNRDKDYPFDYQKIIQYCIKNKIPLKMGYEARNNLDLGADISKTTLNNQPVWEIFWNYPKKIKNVHATGEEFLDTQSWVSRLILDGKTGKEISRESGREKFIDLPENR